MKTIIYRTELTDRLCKEFPNLSPIRAYGLTKVYVTDTSPTWITGEFIEMDETDYRTVKDISNEEFIKLIKEELNNEKI